jgi:hypothetical protein
MPDWWYEKLAGDFVMGLGVGKEGEESGNIGRESGERRS